MTKISSIKKVKKQLSCPKCKNKSIIKSGMVQGEQRWKCKACSYQFTRIVQRGRPLWQKSLVVFLYCYGVSLHAIAKIFDVQPSTVLKWVKLYAKDYTHTPEISNVHIMSLAEMQDIIQNNINNDPSTLFISINDAIFKNGAGISITKQSDTKVG
jgi:transposase-like protein